MMKNTSELSAQKQKLLAELLRSRLNDVQHRQTIPRHNRSSAPLSFAQQRMWFLYQFESDKALYNIPLVMRLNGPLQIGALKDAIGEIVRRHEALRTSFTMLAGESVQMIHPPRPADVRIIDLEECAGKGEQVEIKRIVQAQAHAAFDLAHAPLVRIVLLRI